MRILNQQYVDRKLEQVDGIKIDLGDEWVLILPDPDGPFFHIIAEGSSDEQARVLTEKYAGLVSRRSIRGRGEYRRRRTKDHEYSAARRQLRQRDDRHSHCITP